MNPDSPILMLDKPISIEFTVEVSEAFNHLATSYLDSAKALGAMKTSTALAAKHYCPCCDPAGTYRPKHQMPREELLTVQLLTDLRGASRVLRGMGWVRGDWVTPRGVCGLGAAMVQIAGTPVVNPHEFSDGGRYRDRYYAVAEALGTWLGIQMPVFNDRVARSGEQVIEEIDALAFEVERYLCEKHGMFTIRTTDELQHFDWDSWAGQRQEDERRSLAALQAVEFTITPEAIAKLWDVPVETLGLPKDELVPA